MGMNGFVDLLFLGSGIYLIVTACMAKKKGTISANVMLDKHTNENAIKDKQGFIDYMYKRILLAGILIIIAAAVNLVNDYYFSSIALNWVGILIILAAIVIYVAAYKKGQKTYIVMQSKSKGNKKRGA